VTFNYQSLLPDDAQLAQNAATRIKQFSAKAAQAAIAIGNELLVVKDTLRHGQFIAWLDAEFDWTDRTARRYIRLATTFKTDNLSDLNISLSALHLLASPSVSEDDRKAAVELARESGGLSFTNARDLLTTPDPIPAVSAANSHSDPPYSAPVGGTLIFPGDEESFEDSGDEEVYRSALPLGRFTVTRTTERERITETAEIELHQQDRQPLPARIAEPFYIDPIMVFNQPPMIERRLEQLHELYYLATGRQYHYIPRGE
jgi:hypothetical protein